MEESKQLAGTTYAELSDLRGDLVVGCVGYVGVKASVGWSRQATEGSAELCTRGITSFPNIPYSVRIWGQLFTVDSATLSSLNERLHHKNKLPRS